MKTSMIFGHSGGYDYICEGFAELRTGQGAGCRSDLQEALIRWLARRLRSHGLLLLREKDAENKTTEMGRKSIVPYGLYRAEGYISANLARKVTGFSEEDLELLWEAIINMFEHDHSAARGKMSVRELIVFKHSRELGDCPAYKLFDAVEVRKNGNVMYPGVTRITRFLSMKNRYRVSGSKKDDLMEYAEDDYLMISGIQHFKFLPAASGH